MKRTVRIVVAMALLLLIAVTSIVVYFINVTGGEGSSSLEKWIGNQLRAVAGANLNVELSFENPDYQYPLTIVVENIRLTAPDPANADKTIDILRIGKATLTVAQIPKEGQPLHIERVVLDEPEFSLVCTSATDATLIGFSNIIKTSQDPATPSDPVQAPAKITDVFRIRLVHLLNGKVHYDPRDPDERAMMLDRINLVLNVEPDEEGWYKLNTRIDRAPISELSVAGRFNINDNIAEFDDLSLSIALGDENNRSLPPQMQRALADYDLRGTLSAKAKGTIRFDDWINASMDLDVNLKEGNVSFGEYRLNLPHVALALAMKDRRVDLKKLDAKLLDGTIAGNGQVQVQQPFNADVRLQGDDLHIHQVLKAASSAGASGVSDASAAAAESVEAQELPFRGIVSFRTNARAPLGELTTRLNGGGHLTLRQGRLLNIGPLNQFEDGLAGALNASASKRKKPGANDSIDLLFNFKNDRMLIDRLDYRSSIVAARGSGEMLLDGLLLNLIVNGGPIEKLQSLLGPIGDLTALVTDRVAKYQITGPVNDPKVKTIIAEGLFDQLFR